MRRWTLIFGNGLGMAIEPRFYRLERAIEEVWSGTDCLDEAQKSLIRSCLAAQGAEDMPKGEADLDVLQVALVACDFLNSIDIGGAGWLSRNAKKFPDAVRRFIYRTASQFHCSDKSLPEEFVDSLVDFIKASKSHVAPLNYDNLLYDPLISNDVLCGYNGELVDGFHSSGFDVDNLERKFGRDFGYYLHLHGSPLFVDRGGSVRKLKRNELDEQADVVGSHIVLTHVEHKVSVIDSSPVLRGYWGLLASGVDESEGVLLFGYSGDDIHLNNLIRRAASSKPVKVVEWKGTYNRQERKSFWESRLGRKVDVRLMSDILKFYDWPQ